MLGAPNGLLPRTNYMDYAAEVNWFLGNWVNQFLFGVITLGKLTWNLIHLVS